MSGTLYPGNAAAWQVLAGATFCAGPLYNSTGTMPNNGSLTYGPSTAAQSIPAGYTPGGTISAVTGTAATGDVRASKTASSANGIGFTGTLADNGNGGTYNPTTTDQTFALGIWDTALVFKGDANFGAANIKYNVAMWGTTGTFTGDATATAGQMLASAVAYVQGAKVTGTIPTVAGGNTITPTTTSQTAIAATTYATSAITVAGDSSLVSTNIANGVSIFGVTGTVKRYATGTVTVATNGSSEQYWTVSGLTFTPSDLYVFGQDSNGQTFWVSHANSFYSNGPGGEITGLTTTFSAASGTATLTLGNSGTYIVAGTVCHFVAIE